MSHARAGDSTPLSSAERPVAERRTFAGDRRRAVALPLGGIGTGNLALGGTGVLTQWQLHNQGNHLGFSPQSFFALRLSCTEPPLSLRRMLHGPAIAPHGEPAPLVNDALDAAARYARPASWPGVRDTTFHGAYPFARIDYADDWPVQVQLEAYTPFVPLDAEASSLPLASFTFRITNQFSHPVHGWLLGALQNLVGWDGVTPVRDDRCAVLGGNVNRMMSSADGTGLVLANDDLDPRHPGYGSMALWTPAAAAALPQFDDTDAALAFADSLKLVNVTVLDDWSAEASARALAELRPVMRGPQGPSAWPHLGRGAGGSVRPAPGRLRRAAVRLRVALPQPAGRLRPVRRRPSRCRPRRCRPRRCRPGQPGSAITMPPSSPERRRWSSTSPDSEPTCSSAPGAGTMPSTTAACPT